ncbi:MAG: hypothetical protein AAF500_06265 [Myxococcota bacterium]
MGVHRQRCQSCDSTRLNNLLVRQPGKDQVVLVVCAECHDLVARYELSSYYHHGKGFESWLRQVRNATESALDLSEAFEKTRDNALNELAEALAKLETEGKPLERGEP